MISRRGPQVQLLILHNRATNDSAPAMENLLEDGESSPVSHSNVWRCYQLVDISRIRTLSTAGEQFIDNEMVGDFVPFRTEFQH